MRTFVSRSPFLFVARGVLAGIALCACVAAHAQFGGGGGGGMRGGGGMGRGDGPSGASAQQAPAAPSLPDQLYQVRIRLLVTQEQSAAWERFYRDVLVLAGSTQRQPPGDLANASQAVQLQLESARQRAVATERLAASWEALHAQLDDRQQETADQVIPPVLLQATTQPASRARAGDGR
jgi:hypothetical protein